MVECSNEYIYYKKKRINKKRFFSLFLALFILVSIIIYYDYVASQLCEICVDYSYSYSNECVNEAVMTTLSDTVNYADLVYVEKNDSGEIILLTSNAQKINYISRTVEKLALEKLKAKLKSGVKIPFWAFSGIKILAGYGREIRFDYLSVSSVVCEFSSEFKSVGINQTLHSIYVNVFSTVNIEIPFSKRKSECVTSVLITETVLVGKIPEIYLNKKAFS